MGKKLVLALAVAALVASPAFAAVQNVKVGGSLKTTSVIRSNFDLGSNTGAAGNQTHTNQNVILSQTHLDVSADLTDNVSTKIGLLQEKLWGNDNGQSSNGNIDMETAYVTMKELLYSPLSVTVGRQPLAYGNQMIIGQNTAITNRVTSVTDLSDKVNFDAVKAVLSYDPLVVDLFASKITEGTNFSQNDRDDTDLYGINLSYKLGDKMNTVAEAYTFARFNKTVVSNVGNTKGDKIYVPGLRLSTNPIEGLNLQLEGAYQGGSKGFVNGKGQDTTNATAIQGMVNYALPVMKDMNPVLSGSYSYFSKAWDVMYENQNVGKIYDSIIRSTNLQVAQAAVEITPIKDLTTKLTWSGLWVAAKNQALTFVQPSADVFAPATTTKKSVGNEVDLDLTYAYTEDVKFGVSAGYFFPGKTFTADNKDAASQVLSSVSVAF